MTTPLGRTAHRLATVAACLCLATAAAAEDDGVPRDEATWDVPDADDVREDGPAAAEAPAASKGPEVVASIDGWDGRWGKSSEKGRPLHYASTRFHASVACPSGFAAAKLALDADPMSGVVAPPPGDGGDGGDGAEFPSSPIVVQGQRAEFDEVLALKPGGVYRLRAVGTCCATLSDEGGCQDEGEPSVAVSEEVEIPPVIEAVRILEGGYSHGALLAGRDMATTVYDSVPVPGWSIEGDNLRKHLKLSGAGVDLKTHDYGSSHEGLKLPAMTPTSTGTLEVTLTVKGRLYTPDGRFVREYALTSEPFHLTVANERCVLDANVNAYVLEGDQPLCLDESALSTTPASSGGDEGGCSSAGAPGDASAWLLALLSLAFLPAAGTRRESRDGQVPGKRS